MRRLILLPLAALPAVAAAQPAAPLMATPVLARTVEKGDRLSAADFETAQRPASVARSALAPADATGQEAARRLMAGSPVRATDVTRPQMVKRGETVVVTVRAGALSITTTGKALSGGGIGDAVRVLTLSTNRTLDAVVEATGHVRVNTL